ncbi:MAG: hypothetical protein R3C68_13990 [Myxococcota bacterium]
MEIDCSGTRHRISPLVYSIAYYPMNDHKDQHVWAMKPGARRWGGNHTSRYNWRLGNAWNTAHDWFYTNVNYTPDKNYHWSKFFAANRQNGVKTALTIPSSGGRHVILNHIAFRCRFLASSRQ